MLKGISPLISPDILRALAAMGHGDYIALCDANCPAESFGRTGVHWYCVPTEFRLLNCSVRF